MCVWEGDIALLSSKLRDLVNEGRTAHLFELLEVVDVFLKHRRDAEAFLGLNRLYRVSVVHQAPVHEQCCYT